MDLLISGTSSGLGRHLLEALGGTAFRRDTPGDALAGRDSKPFDAIIHCAFDTRSPQTSSTLAAAITANLELTRRLTEIPHRTFVFISSIDVYPLDGRPHGEDEDLPLAGTRSDYGAFKLMAEAVVRAGCRHPLILRPAAMLGRHARPNSLMRIMAASPGTPLSLGLAGNSLFNYLLHDDVSDFIRLCLERNEGGTFTLASRTGIRLDEAAERLGRRVQFGTFRYDAGELDNHRAAARLDRLNGTSWETIERFRRLCL